MERLGINNRGHLDPLGIIYRKLNKDELPRRSYQEVDAILKESLNPLHPIFKLPPEFNWDDNNHLEISFAIGGTKLKNEPIPKLEIQKHEDNSVEQLCRIPIDKERSIIITFTLCPNKLENSIQWNVKRK